MVEPLAYRLMVCFCLSLQEMTTSLLDGIVCERGVRREVLDGFVRLLMNAVCWWILKGFIKWLDIADLFSFLISFALKKEEQESSLDFVIVMIREGLFSLEQRTKACFMSFRVSLTPATILRRAILENAKAFSVHETGF